MTRLRVSKAATEWLRRGSIFALLAWSHLTVAQTLNQATTAQLISDANFQPCATLLGGDDPLAVLTGELVNICTRSVNQAGPASASSGGGFAATPPSPPNAVAARLDTDEDDATGASIRGFFLTLGAGPTDRIASPFEDGYRSDVQTFAAGFDRVFGNRVFGIAVDGSEQEGDFLDGGTFEIRSVGLTGFGSYLTGETSSLDFYVGIAQLSNDRLRRATFTEISGDDMFPATFAVVGAPTADFDADQALFGVQYAYDWVWDNVTFGPRVAYDWKETDYDRYDELDNSGLALTFHGDKETSSQFSVGFAGTVAISADFGVVVIDQSLLYRYESDLDQRSAEVSFVEDTRARRFTYQTEIPDRSFLEFSVGATFVLRNGLQLMAEYRSLGSHQYLESSAFAAGFRKEF